MDVKYYKEIIKILDLKFADKKIKNFLPKITKNFAKDKRNFSQFWKACNSQINILAANKKHKSFENKLYTINKISTLSKKIFLSNYANKVYNSLTKNKLKFIRVEDLVYEVNKLIPFITPSKEQIKIENNRSLSNKLGIELDQGIFLSAILSDPLNGSHLCEAMLRPSKLALDNLEEFCSSGYINFGKAIVKEKDNFTEVILNNPKYLNAEDEFTLYPLEAAIDLALLSTKSKICILRGAKVNHPKYKQKRIFGSGINLTHLYEGKISFMWYLIREMGAVHKVYRGINAKSNSLHNLYYPSLEKLWIGALETFAIGGGCQFLLTLDHIVADKNAYMTLPARKEGIIPGAANLRLWRFVGDRVSRQAIQNGLKINVSDHNGKRVCDNIVNYNLIGKTLSKTVKEYHNSGVIGAAFNRRALRFSQETLDQFREYLSYYSHDQAYCHLSKDLIANLEKFWNKTKN